MKPLLDVLTILDALEKKDSLAAASAKLFRTPSALSYTVHKLESDLNIQLFDHSGHRARFTRTGQMLLEKGRKMLCTAHKLEKRAIKFHGGQENELVTDVDDMFLFSLLAPLIESFYQHRSVARLKLINDALDGSQDILTQGRTDIVVGVIHESPTASKFDFTQLGVLEQVSVVAPHHPLAQEQEPSNRCTIRRFYAIVAGDNAQHANVSGSQVLDDQEAIAVSDFKTKLELQTSGLRCGYIPRHLAQRSLDSGLPTEKKVVGQILLEPVWIGRNEQAAGFANAWWRDEILVNSVIAEVHIRMATDKSIS